LAITAALLAVTALFRSTGDQLLLYEELLE
jgi:hypothetical protein